MIVTLLLASAAAQASASPPPEIGHYALSYPFPSPDGRQLAFEANFDGRDQLYVMDLESEAISRLHVSEGNDTNPAWSPDGRLLAFRSDRDGNNEIYVLELETGEVRSIAPHPGRDGHPKFSPDGRHVYFNRTFDPADTTGDEDSAILRVDLESGTVETVTDSPLVETFPHPSPDGREVVFVQWQDGPDGEANANGELIVYDMETGERRNITNRVEFDGYPAWGPDGWIYFASRTDTGEPGGEFDIYRIRPDGSDLTGLTTGDAIADARPMPSADGERLYYNQHEPGRVTVHVLDLTDL